jgi:hypothetical protein
MNTPMVTYDNVLGLVRRLNPVEQARLLEELATLLRHRVASQSRRSILELQGLGKEIWRGVDVQAYVKQERDSWNG